MYIFVEGYRLCQRHIGNVLLLAVLRHVGKIPPSLSMTFHRKLYKCIGR